MFTLSTSQGSNTPGYNFSAQVNDTGGGVQPHNAALAAAIAAVMASGTTFTVPTGSIANGATIGIFWLVGGVLKGAVNLLVTGVAAGSPNDTVTVSATNVAYVGGAVALPSSGAITVSVAYAVDVSFAIANVNGLAISSDQIAVTQFFSSAAASSSVYVDTRSPVPSEYRYSVSRGDAAPFSGSVVSANAYNAATTIANWQMALVTAT